MNKALEMIKTFIDGKMEPMEFSFALPDLLIEEYDSMMEENQEATEILNDELPDICADYEPGMNPDAFRKKVKAEYEKAIAEM